MVNKHLYTTALIILCIVSCNVGDEPKNIEIWKNRFLVNLTEQLRIGSEDLYDDKYTFSGINDLRIDSSNCVYVLDRKEKRIKIYSPQGKYEKTIFLKTGQGPGEFSYPLFFDIMSNGNIAITDNRLSRLTILNQEGTYIDSMSLNNSPGRIAVDRDNYIYSTSGLYSISDYGFYKYDYQNKTLIKAFCKHTHDSKLASGAGQEGELCIDKSGDILYAFSLPYKIVRYSSTGQIKGQYSRVLENKNEFKINDMGLPESKIITLALTCFSDGKILYVYLDKTSKPYVRWLDIFNSNGDWLIGLSSKKVLSDWDGRLARLDKDNNLYLEYWKPFPHIRKYALKFVESNK